MTRYKLPDALGGAEVDAVADYPGHQLVQVDAGLPGGRLWLHRADLVEVVEPPLPPEPPIGSTVRVGRRVAYFRDDLSKDVSRSWYGPGGLLTWKEVCELSVESTGLPPTLLVPAPEPVKLPWSDEEHNDQAEILVVACDDPGEVRVGFWTLMTKALDPVAAREMARALWTAADQAEDAS